MTRRNLLKNLKAEWKRAERRRRYSEAFRAKRKYLTTRDLMRAA